MIPKVHSQCSGPARDSWLFPNLWSTRLPWSYRELGGCKPHRCKIVMIGERILTRLYSVPSSILSIRIAALLLIADFTIGMGYYVLFAGYSLVDAFYMIVITVSTVGFEEVRQLDNSAKLFTSFYILLNLGLFAYLLSTFTYYIIQGEIFKKMHLNFIRDRISDLKDHIIICGYGRYGREIAVHFQKHSIPFVIIDNGAETIEYLQQSEGKILYIEGDATHDEVLLDAGIRQAKAIIAALPDDSDNVFTVLTANQLNPKINIISRAKDSRSSKKLQLAGANHVIMPEQIGGFYMATLVTKPDSVEFFSFISNEYKTDVGFEEITYEEAPKHCQDRSIREIDLRQETGVNIIGFKDAFGNYIVNPQPDATLVPGSSLIVLGNREQLDKLT